LKTYAGKSIAFEGTVSPVRNGEGIVESLVVRLRDITLEVEKDRHLRQAQKMDALGALAGGMAHDFNNLIGAILHAAELIEMQIEPDSPIQRKLEIIQQVGGRARELSAQILNFSRRTDDTWVPFDLTSLVTEVISLLETTLPKNVQVRCDLAKGVRILGDPSQFHQVIMNLGINGSQAMQPGGGVLSIELQPGEAGRRVGDQSFLEPYVLLTINDTGCGMDPQTLERIFEPFFTTKKVGQGTGLGLSVVYGIVHGHGGSLHVASEPGKGSSFKIRLPACQDSLNGLEGKTAASNVTNLFMTI
jgi:signal transduction histidine kinase